MKIFVVHFTDKWRKISPDFDSTGDACQYADDLFKLSERKSQELWDYLKIKLPWRDEYIAIRYKEVK